MHIILIPLISILMTVLDLYIWALVLSVAISWLVTFNIINTHNRFTYLVGDFLYRITEPILCKIRRVVPVVGGIDLSPMILIIGVMFLKTVLEQIAWQVSPGW